MSWQTDYLAALHARDRREQASKAVVDAYTALADRTANARTSKPTTSQPDTPSSTGLSSRTKPKPSRTASTPTGGLLTTALGSGGGSGGGGGGGGSANPLRKSSTPPSPRPSAFPPPSSSLSGSSSLQADLAAAQSARASLQEQVRQLTQEREAARTELAQETARAGLLAAERGALAQRLRDRDEELRGKAKLLDDVQNEAVTLEMQLNVTEERNRELKRENEDLVARWIAKKQDEVDRANLESRFT